MHQACCVQILEAACSILEVTADSCQPPASQPRQKPQAAPVGREPQPQRTKRLRIPESGDVAAAQDLHVLDPVGETEERYAGPVQAAGAGAALKRCASCLGLQNVRPAQGRRLLLCPASLLKKCRMLPAAGVAPPAIRAHLGPEAPRGVLHAGLLPGSPPALDVQAVLPTADPALQSVPDDKLLSTLLQVRLVPPDLMLCSAWCGLIFSGSHTCLHVWAACMAKLLQCSSCCPKTLGLRIGDSFCLAGAYRHRSQVHGHI